MGKLLEMSIKTPFTAGEAPTILIIGTGAMACLFAARLAASGIQVTMLGTWVVGLQALQQYGVRLVDNDGSQKAYPVVATNDPQLCRETRFGLVMVKSWQTPRAAKQLAGCLSIDGLVLSLQNGAGNFESLTAALGARRVALGVTTVGATLLSPGLVRAAGEGIISLSAHPALMPLASLLRSANFVVENAPDANALLWGKLVINAAINPLTAILRLTNGELLSRDSAHALLRATAREAAAVAVAQGIRLPYPDPVVAAETIARRTATNRSSMLQDIERGAPTEIDAICGAIVKAGEQTGVATPINRTLWQMVKALEEKGNS
jgi:2-dehydropantoate 2-reductase